MSARRVSIVIRRPVDEVFAYMDDVSREPEWQPQLRVSEQTPPGPSAVGSRRRYVSDFLGREVENTYVVRAIEPGRRLLLETSPESVVDATTEIVWDEVPDGTRVTMSVDGRPKGVLKLLPRRLVEGTFEKELERALARLKTVLEQGD